MNKYIIRFAILLMGLVSTQAAFADVKIKIRQTMSGQTYENTTYIKGKRQRAEQNMGGMQTVNLTQCDLKRGVQIMPASQTYLISPWGTPAESVAPSQSVTKTQTPTQKGGVITSTYTIKDTGERKQMFGYTARHLIITMETESSPDACTPMKSKMQTDGWYIDAAFALDCDMAQYSNYRPPAQKNGGCQDRFQSKQIGIGKRGYPLYEKMTMFDESGKETYSFVNEVIELSNTTLDAALFDIPAGYREVKDSSELYASMSSQSMRSNSASTSRSDELSLANLNSNSSNLKTPSQNVSTTVGAKKEGVTRIGLANVKTGSVSDGMNAQALAQVIQNTFAEQIKTPQIELVQLEGTAPSAIDAEAKNKECDYVVYANVSYKKGGGGGMFGKIIGHAAGTAISSVGYGSTGAAVAAGIASTAIYTAASLSGNIKSKDEITLEVKVQTPESTAVLTKQFKAKAKSDGDDIITAVVEQSSQAIVASVEK
jgi:hypothetical protein